MPKTKLHFILLIGMALPLACCKKDPPPDPPDPPCYEENGLPCATQTGENIYGCLVNGELWLPKGDLTKHPIEQAAYNTENSLFGFKVNNGNDYGCLVRLRQAIKNCESTGVYPMMTNYTYYIGCFNEMEGEFLVDTNATNYMEITYFDLSQPVISGRFEYTLVDENSGDTLHITDGRFDLSNILIQ